MIRRIPFILLAALLLAAPSGAAAQLKVVTSTTDLYDIAKEVGGDRIVATHIGEGYQDPHFVEAKPSFVLQLRNADVWAFVGLDLEIGWMPLLLDGARWCPAQGASRHRRRLRLGRPARRDRQLTPLTP